MKSCESIEKTEDERKLLLESNENGGCHASKSSGYTTTWKMIS